MPGRHHEDDENLIVGSQLDDGMARPLVARATGYRMDLESETFVVAPPANAAARDDPEPVVANPIRASDGHHGWSGPRGDGDDKIVVADPISAHEGKTYSHEGRNNFRMHNVVQAFDWQQAGDARYRPVRAGDYTGALSETRQDAVSYSAGVRRLTPLECERLQGFPDGWTDIRVRGKPIADAHRYRMLGNAVDTVVAQWLGHRLAAVDATLSVRRAGSGSVGTLLRVGSAPYWFPVRDGDPVARGLFTRHYSSTLKRTQPVRPIGNGEKFCGPGEHMVLLGADSRALFVWRMQRFRKDGQVGVECTVFRNEGERLSSELILEACDLAQQRWPQLRCFTFVEPEATRRRRSRRSLPGQCFIYAGWSPCGESAGGLAVLELRTRATVLNCRENRN